MVIECNIKFFELFIKSPIKAFKLYYAILGDILDRIFIKLHSQKVEKQAMKLLNVNNDVVRKLLINQLQRRNIVGFQTTAKNLIITLQCSISDK